MMSGINPTNGDDSTMPGDYESWPAPGARNGPMGGASLQPMIPPARTPFPRLPPGRTPFPRLPPGTSAGRPPMRRPPMLPNMRPAGRRRRHRRRPLTPEIVIDRRHRSHSSWGGRRVITIPLDHRPTLGLRGPAKRVVEIESVRCRRRRRPRSVCYEYDDPPPQIQQPMIVANPGLPAVAQQPMMVPMNNIPNAASTAVFLSNLTQETVNNLPRQTVHLPPIHLPGSQADANTELETVIFPAEIINPIDGTLSIIQANPAANQFAAAPPSQLIHIAPRVAPVSPAMAADPLMQRFQELFQRLSIPQTQPITPTQNPPMIRPTLPVMSQFNPANNPINNLPIIPSISTANIRPSNPLNIGSYRSAISAPTVPGNIPSYRPTNFPSYRPSSFTPSSPTNNATYRPTSVATSDGSDMGPYQRANITPYTNSNNQSSMNNPVIIPPSTSYGPTPYSSAPLAPSTPRTPFPRLYPSPGMDSNSLNPSFSLPSLAPNQSMNSMPKSILRNTTSTDPTTTVYTRLNSSNVLSSNGEVRNTTTSS